MRAALALAAVLALLGTAPAQAQRRHSILQAGGGSVRVRLLDERSKPLANAPVEVWSDNGIRCIRAPCPTNGRKWQGRTDAAGFVVVPRSELQASTTITAPGYAGDLIQGAQQGPDGTWKLRLRASRGAAPQ